jgi:endonuclease YncB( thermonuclease family)
MTKTMKRFFLLCVAANLFGIAVCAQGTFTANAVDVVDGRTVVLEVAGGRLTAQLQYIETPEPEQPLHKVVQEHLARLVVGKAVEFKAARMIGGKTVGRITINGIDLSAQMIRDGAAWHEPRETSGQSDWEADDYDKNQQLAKSEKRGVWSGAVLRTPWELRAEKDAQLRGVDAARAIAHPTLVGLGEFQSDGRRPSGNHIPTPGVSSRNQMDAWVSAFAGAAKEAYGLHTYSDPKGRFSMVMTSPALIDFSSTAGKERLECRAMYVTLNLSNGSRTSLHLIGFRAISEDYRFSKSRSRLTAVLDRQPIVLGSPEGLRRQGLIGAEELMFYKVSGAAMKKIGNAKNVEMRIDKLSGTLPPASRDLFKQLADATN